VPAMVHVSASVNPAFHGTGATTSTPIHGLHAAHHGRPVQGLPDLKADHPARRGAVPFHWGRYAASRSTTSGRRLDELMRQRVVRHLRLSSARCRSPHQGGAARQHPVRVGDGRRGARRRPAQPASRSTTQALCHNAPGLSAADKKKIFETTAYRAYPRLKDTIASRRRRRARNRNTTIKRSIERLPWVSKNIGYRNIGYRNIGYRNIGYRTSGTKHWDISASGQGPGDMERLRQELPRHAADRQEPRSLAFRMDDRKQTDGDRPDGGQGIGSSAGRSRTPPRSTPSRRRIRRPAPRCARLGARSPTGGM